MRKAVSDPLGSKPTFVYVAKTTGLRKQIEARHYRGDKLIRTAKPHKFLDADNGPLIAVRLNLITRKTLGGLQTDLDSQMIDATGAPIEGLYAVGEAVGFGGG